MADKKKNELTFMQVPLPVGQNSFKLTKIDWRGLNRRITIDSGVLSAESNISNEEAPYLVPSQIRTAVKTGYTNPICMFGFKNFLLVIYRETGVIKIDYITATNTYTGTLKASGATSADEYPRSIVKFNVYNTPLEPITGTYTEKLLIFPDRLSMDFNITANFTPNALTGVPAIKYATVYLSRLFGVDDDRMYASGFNDYTNWTLDTIDTSSANNAWVSPAQANTQANSAFTGITTFSNHVIGFKRDYMHELYNNKNPFRIQDIYAEGSIDMRSIQDVDGRLMFASPDNVKMYTGGNPRVIGENLNINSFDKAVSGNDGTRYYLYCESGSNKYIFVYDTRIDQWSEEAVPHEVISFAHNQNGMYMLCANGTVYKMDTGSYTEQVWSCETDLFLGKTIDIKHIKKIQLLADMGASSTLKIHCLYDDEVFNSSTSQEAYSGSAASAVRVPIRIVPRQTANYGFKLRFSGTGYVKLYQLEMFLQQGGELYV